VDRADRTGTPYRGLTRCQGVAVGWLRIGVQVRYRGEAARDTERLPPDLYGKHATREQLYSTTSMIGVDQQAVVSSSRR
jgi:hypothetical protein